MSFFSSKDFLARVICLIIVLLPFIICDLYFGYNDTSCIYIPIVTPQVDINLSIWLRVDGLVLLSIVVSFIIVLIVALWNDIAAN